MPDLNEFYVFKSTNGGDGGSGGFGCLTWLLIIVAVFSIVAELAN